ncbi:hypothetical protein WEH80_29450 [Actinomycetes bacterium KLBMP 9759]
MQGRALLAVSVLSAILITVGTTVALVLLEPAASKGEALKTGGLAGGAIVALYALWLNDRRRRTEEARHELESDKIADERFTRSVELLGNEADQVRVGALHALAWHADTTPRYRQTVIDVLCAYLRRPFHDPAASANGTRPDPAELLAVDRERQVRSTAQRLIADLLPWGQSEDTRVYHLDLSGAHLEHFRLEGRRIGRLVARGARFVGITQMNELQASKPVLLTDASFAGRLTLRDARLDGGLSVKDSTFASEVALAGAAVSTFLDARGAAPPIMVGGLSVAPGTRVDGDGNGWVAT